MKNSKLRIGLSLSLTGRYAEMGRQAHAALRLFAADQNAGGGLQAGGGRREVSIICHDDASDAVRCAEIYRWICSGNQADLIFGPYASGLARIAAPIAEGAGIAFVNHGGACDRLYERGYRLMVGVLSPASGYLVNVVRLLASLKFWRKKIALVASRGGFAETVANGFRQACSNQEARRRGIRIRLDCAGAGDPSILAGIARQRLQALVSAGSFEHDVALIRAVIRANLNIPVLACVAAGIQRFQRELGDEAEGIVGPSQWEEQLDIKPEIGPTPFEFARRLHCFEPGIPCDYPAAQIYAAGLLTAAALARAGSLDQNRLREAFSDLLTTTLFGNFAIDRVTGRQTGHKILLVQWHQGGKTIIDPQAHAKAEAIHSSPGWRSILSSLRSLVMTSGGHPDNERTGDRS